MNKWFQRRRERYKRDAQEFTVMSNSTLAACLEGSVSPASRWSKRAREHMVLEASCRLASDGKLLNPQEFPWFDRSLPEYPFGPIIPSAPDEWIERNG